MMHVRLSAFALVALFALPLSGQDAAISSDQPRKPNSYIVTITEFQLDTSAVDVPPAEIASKFEQLKKDGHVDWVETVRLSVLEGHQSTVQFGKTVALTTGMSQTASGRTSRQSTDRQLGTAVKISAHSNGERVGLELDYQSSRIDGSTQEEGLRPDIATMQVETAVLMSPGSPTLIAGMSGSDSTFLLVSVKR